MAAAKSGPKKERPARVKETGPGREAVVGQVRDVVWPDGKTERRRVSEVRQLPGGVVVVIEHGREVG